MKPWEQNYSVATEAKPWEQVYDQPAQPANTYKGLDIVKTTNDGGMVLRDPKGNLMFLNEQAGYSTTDPDVVSTIMGGEEPGKAATMAAQEQIVQQSPVAARGLKFAEGLPFVGSWLDEMAPEKLQSQMRATSQAMEATRPGESTALNVAGGVVGSIPIALAAPQVAMTEGVPLAMNALKLGTLGGAAGGIEGAIYGAGAAEEGQRGQGAIKGGLLGAAGGTIGGVASPLFAKGYENVARSLANKPIKEIAKQFDISEDAARLITNQMTTGGDFNQALANLRRAGDTGMLADADKAAAALLDAAAAAGGQASNVVAGAVDTRAATEGARLAGIMDGTLGALPEGALGTKAGVKTIADQVAASTRDARRAAYTAAYTTPIDYSADAGRGIEKVFSTIPERFKRTAISRANELMTLDKDVLGDVRQIMADVADDGSVTLMELPNVVQLDYVKRALGEVANQTDQFGRATPDAVSAQKMYTQLRDAIVDAAPAYGEAMKLGADKITRDNALDFGTRLLRPGVTVEDAVRTLKNSTDVERQYAKLGVRSYIDNFMDNVKATVNSPDVDINTLRNTLREFSSKANRNKIGMVVGPEQAKGLFTQLDKAQAALELRAAVAVNSKTAIRQAIKQQAEDIVQPGAVGRIAEFKPGQAAQQAVQTVTGATPEVQTRKMQKLYVDVAKALTGIRGDDAKNALNTLYLAANGQDVSDEALLRVSDIILNNITPATALTGGAATRQLGE